MTSLRIGMIGVGMMGHGIARNVLKAGWPLSYLDHPGNQPTADLDEAGGIRVSDPRELARDIDVLLLCVTGSNEAEAILSGETGLIGALPSGCIVVDCSTGVPQRTAALAAQAERAGIRYVDAAMTRTPKEAEEGRLNLLIGGAPQDIEAVTPLLEAFSENRFHAGPVSSGQKLKLLHNFVSLGSVVLIGEAAACAAENDISADVFVDCLRRGGGYGAALDRVAPYLLEGDTSAMRFTNANAMKDLGYYNALVEKTGTGSKVAGGVLEALRWLHENGQGDAMLPEACDGFRGRKNG